MKENQKKTTAMAGINRRKFVKQTATGTVLAFGIGFIKPLDLLAAGPAASGPSNTITITIGESGGGGKPPSGPTISGTYSHKWNSHFSSGVGGSYNTSSGAWTGSVSGTLSW